MGMLLQKGQKIDLFKTDGDIKTISVAIGWEQSQKNSGYNLDIDVSAFILNANGKIDAIKLTFSENITDATLNPANFSI